MYGPQGDPGSGTQAHSSITVTVHGTTVPAK